MQDYISLTEAAASTGKSEMTIRRLSKKTIANQYIKNENGLILISKAFVESVYPSNSSHVISDNKEVLSVNNHDNRALTTNEELKNEILILTVKLEGKEELLQSQKQHIDLLEKRFKDYQDEKQNELDLLHQRWSQEQEIFKRDQQINAGKLIQQNQPLQETEERKKRRWWLWP